jgi:hypothetical protein
LIFQQSLVREDSMFVTRVRVGVASLARFSCNTGPQWGLQGVKTSARPENCEETSSLLYAAPGSYSGGAIKQAFDPKRHQVEERIQESTRNLEQDMAQSAGIPLALLASAPDSGLATTACRGR